MLQILHSYTQVPSFLSACSVVRNIVALCTCDCTASFTCAKLPLSVYDRGLRPCKKEADPGDSHCQKANYWGGLGLHDWVVCSPLIKRSSPSPEDTYPSDRSNLIHSSPIHRRCEGLSSSVLPAVSTVVALALYAPHTVGVDPE